jgi:hypothetical protein
LVKWLCTESISTAKNNDAAVEEFFPILIKHRHQSTLSCDLDRAARAMCEQKKAVAISGNRLIFL